MTVCCWRGVVLEAILGVIGGRLTVLASVGMGGFRVEFGDLSKGIVVDETPLRLRIGGANRRVVNAAFPSFDRRGARVFSGADRDGGGATSLFTGVRVRIVAEVFLLTALSSVWDAALKVD